MKAIDLKSIWIVLLSVIWLAGASQLVEKEAPISQSFAQLEQSKHTNDSSIESSSLHVLYFCLKPLSWLAFKAAFVIPESDYLIPPWPDYGLLNSYYVIVAYQHFISSLSTFSSIN